MPGCVLLNINDLVKQKWGKEWAMCKCENEKM